MGRPYRSKSDEGPNARRSDAFVRRPDMPAGQLLDDAHLFAEVRRAHHGAVLAIRCRMTRPRQVLPEQFIFITRRCTQRQYLLRPDEETNNNVLYCLGCALERFQMDVLMLCFESNHEHLVVYDRMGQYP